MAINDAPDEFREMAGARLHTACFAGFDASSARPGAAIICAADTDGGFGADGI
jgi:hypothetical protein